MSYPYQPPGPQRQVVKRQANHGLHITLSVLTCGLWAVTGWPIAAIMGRKTVTTTVPAALPPQYGPPPGHGYPPAPHGQTPPHGTNWSQPPQH